MSVDVTIRIPDNLGRELEAYRDRLPELLERGLRDVQGDDTLGVSDASDILAVLARQPTPQEVLALRPTDEMQARLTELLQRSKTESLSRSEESEPDRYPNLEHIVRLAKTRALKRIPASP
jgi:hypothetical protein